MTKTRSRTIRNVPIQEKKGSDLQTTALPVSDSNPPRLFILPSNATKEARFLTLECPATSSPTKYFFCPRRGIHEITRVSGGRKPTKSWLLARSHAHTTGAKDETKHKTAGHIVRKPDLYIATAVDEIFFLLPTLLGGPTKKLFQSFDDHMEKVRGSGVTSHWTYILSSKDALARLEKRVKAVCDVLEADLSQGREETMYRFSMEKLANELLSKAKRMVQTGLPASMDEQFVKRPLIPPVVGISNAEFEKKQSLSRQDSNAVSTAGTENGNGALSQSTAQDTQESNATAPTETSGGSDSQQPQPPSTAASPDITNLLRIRTALALVISSYIAPTLQQLINDAIKASDSIDFSPLDSHLSHLSKLRSEAQALFSMSDNISRKRVFEDDEAAELRAEKKNKKEEEEKKKKLETRAAKDLKKVDISGMKKMSSFFQKIAK